MTALDVLPDALARAADLARRHQVDLRTMVHNLERIETVPGGPYDLVMVFRYLHRPLWPALRAAVRQGGCVIYETFHERTLATGKPPRRMEHLLRSGELTKAFEGFEILHTADAVERDGRFFSQLLARRT